MILMSDRIAARLAETATELDDLGGQIRSASDAMLAINRCLLDARLKVEALKFRRQGIAAEADAARKMLAVR